MNSVMRCNGSARVKTYPTLSHRIVIPCCVIRNSWNLNHASLMYFCVNWQIRSDSVNGIAGMLISFFPGTHNARSGSKANAAGNPRSAPRKALRLEFISGLYQ